MSLGGAQRRTGFTLFEVLGVILVTTLLLGVALNFYVDLSRQAARASENTREVRRATAILDRVADDLEHALLVRKPAETDPLAHAWLFLGESSTLSAEGSDRLKFVRRVVPRSSAEPIPDLGVVAYLLEPNDEFAESYTLRRWTHPGLPDELDREFPYPDDPGALLVTDDLAYFATRFLDDAGEWRPAWDSSQLVDSSELPVAVEIEIALATPEFEEDALDDEEPRRYLRQVYLPVRPLDLELLLAPEEDEEGALALGEDEDEELAGLTLADCVDFALIGAAETAAIGLSASDLDALRAQAPTTPFAPYAGLLAGHAAVKPHCQ